MNIFVAGGTGAIGRYLVPSLVTAGHKVVALSRSADGASPLVSMGALPVFGDVYDHAHLARLVAESEAEVVIQQLTAFGTKLSDWLPFAARLLGAPPPEHEDVASARNRIGDIRVYYLNEQRGASNAKAKRDLNWQPAFPSWRAGFEALYSNRTPQSRDAV